MKKLVLAALVTICNVALAAPIYHLNDSLKNAWGLFLHDNADLTLPTSGASGAFIFSAAGGTIEIVPVKDWEETGEDFLGNGVNVYGGLMVGDVAQWPDDNLTYGSILGGSLRLLRDPQQYLGLSLVTGDSRPAYIWLDVSETNGWLLGSSPLEETADEDLNLCFGAAEEHSSRLRLLSDGGAEMRGGAEGPEMVFDGGFESGLSYSWASNGTSTIAASTEHAYAGDYALKVEANGLSSGAKLQLGELIAGVTYEISAQIFIATYAGTTGVKLAVGTNAGVPFALSDGAALTPDEWTEVTLSLTVETTQPLATLFVAQADAVEGTFFLDAVSIKAQGIGDVDLRGGIAATGAVSVGGLAIHGEKTIPADLATPTVTCGRYVTPGATGAVVVTNFLGGTDGAILRLRSGGDADWSISPCTNIALSAAWTADADGICTLVLEYCGDKGKWLELSRSANGMGGD